MATPKSPASADGASTPLVGRKLTKVRLADKLLGQLRQQILSGRLASGTRLPSEAEIGEAFGVGRTTVREALQGLLATGFVERTGKRLIVRDPSEVGSAQVTDAAISARVSVQEVFAVRKHLEVEIARLAAVNRSADDLAALWAILEAMDEADPADYHAHDMEFHTALARATGNQVLAGVYESSAHLFFRLPAFWKVFGPRNPPIGGGRPGHERVYRAIEGGDSDIAAREVFTHLDVVEKALVERIRMRDGDDRAHSATV